MGTLVTVRLLPIAAVVVLTLCFLQLDLNTLPGVDYVLSEINIMIQNSEECVPCGEILRTLDRFHKVHASPLERAAQGFDKPHNSFIRACEKDPNNEGCDTALGKHRAEKTKRALAIVSKAESVAAEIGDASMINLIKHRRTDLIHYLLEDKKRDGSTTYSAEDGKKPRLSTNPSENNILSYVWYFVVPVDERHRNFCWVHCEGSLSLKERRYVTLTTTGNSGGGLGPSALPNGNSEGGKASAHRRALLKRGKGTRRD